MDNQLRSIETIELNDVDEQGPPEAPGSDAEPICMTAGCVSNMNNTWSEFDILRHDAQGPQMPPGVDQVVLSLPQVHGTPINEHMGLQGA